MNFDQRLTHQRHISINNAAATMQAPACIPLCYDCCLDWEPSALILM